MATVSLREAMSRLASLGTFRTRAGLAGETFYRLSGPPTSANLLPTWRTQLLAAHTLNRQHYMPYCKVCGAEVTFGGDMRTWTHTEESAADHVAEQVEHPESYSAPPAGLRYLVTYQRVPLLWVLNDGTVVLPHVDAEHERRQADCFAAIGERVDPKFL